MHPVKFINEDILNRIYGGLYIVDKERRILFWNKEAEEITGFSSDEVIGTFCSDNILTHVDSEGNELCRGMCPLSYTMSDNRQRENEIFLHHKDGHRVPVSVRTNTLVNEKGEVMGGVELFTDNSSLQGCKLQVKELQKLAMLDHLTQMPNRNYMQKELDIRFEEKKRLNIDFGVFYIDIDFFKKVNDSYGHDMGDRVLKFVANTVLKNGRPFDIYGRWGGEEFFAIIRDVSVEELERIGNRMRLLIANSYLVHENKRIQVTVSIGATIVNGNDILDSVVKRADKLMYQSKTDGRNRLTIG